MASWSVRQSGLPVRTMATVTVPGFLPSASPNRRRGEIRFRDSTAGRKLLTLDETDRALKEAEARNAELEARLQDEPSTPPGRR